MLRLIAPKRFQKKLKAFLIKHPGVESIIETKLAILQNDPWDDRLKTHKLSGVLKNCLACNISYEYRLIFYIKEGAIFLLTIGTHDEVY